MQLKSTKHLSISWSLAEARREKLSCLFLSRNGGGSCGKTTAGGGGGAGGILYLRAVIPSQKGKSWTIEVGPYQGRYAIPPLLPKAWELPQAESFAGKMAGIVS